MRMLMALCVFAILAGGCAPKLVVPGPGAAPIKVEKNLKDSNARIVKLSRELKAEQENNKVLGIQRTKSKMYRGAGVCFLIMVLCVAAALFLPVGKKYLIYGAVGAAAGAVLCLFVAAIAQYLVLIGAGVAAVVGAGLIYYLRASEKTKEKLIKTFEPYVKRTPELAEELRDKLDARSKDMIKSVRRRLKLT